MKPITKIAFVHGPTLDECFFYATDGDEEFAIKASDVVTPAIVRMAEAETKEKELPVQPQNYVEMFKKSASTLEDFKRIAYGMAVQNKLQVEAAADKDHPVMATEPFDMPKKQDEPTVAAEAGPLVDAKAKMVGSPVPKFYGRLSHSVSDKPEIALDLQSQVQALTEQNQVLAAERDMVKQELETSKKSQELVGLKAAFSKHGLKWEKYEKQLEGLDPKAIGLIEQLFKDLDGAKKEPDGAPKGPPMPKPPMLMGGSPEKPPIAASANIVHASLDDNADWMDSTAKLTELWARRDAMEDQKRNGGVMTGLGFTPPTR